ncbi:MAG: hypothetical protein ACYTEK_06500 [Planctomycetota bacterium]|jgi:hypothetical protein
MANIQKRKNNIQRGFFLHKKTKKIYVIEYQEDGTIIGSCKAKEPLKRLRRYKCKPDKNIWIQNNRDRFEPFTDSSRTEKLELMRQGHKLRVELSKYKNKVEPDAWNEIKKEIKRLRSGISLVPGAATINGEHVKKENHPEIFTPDYEKIPLRIIIEQALEHVKHDLREVGLFDSKTASWQTGEIKVAEEETVEARQEPTPAEKRAWESYVWVCTNHPEQVKRCKEGQRYTKGMYEKAVEESGHYQDEEGQTIAYPRFQSWMRNLRGYQQRQPKCKSPHGDIEQEYPPPTGDTDKRSELPSKKSSKTA